MLDDFQPKEKTIWSQSLEFCRLKKVMTAPDFFIRVVQSEYAWSVVMGYNL